jgi:hypothetical protein
LVDDVNVDFVWNVEEEGDVIHLVNAIFCVDFDLKSD